MAPVGPFDEESRSLYERLLAPLGLDGRIAEGPVPTAAAPTPTITATWVLMVRRRSTMYRRFFAGLRDALVSEQIDVAAPLAVVVADEPSRLDLDRGLSEEGSWQQAAEQLLMIYGCASRARATCPSCGSAIRIQSRPACPHAEGDECGDR